MDDLYAIIRATVIQLLNKYRMPQKGIVSSYDPATHKAKVILQPQQIETGWLQVASHSVGKGFGLVYGLQRGDEVMVTFDRGDINSGVVSAGCYNGQDLPVKCKPGEWKLVHKSGSYLKFFENGDVELRVKGKYTEIVDGVTLHDSATKIVTNTPLTQSWVTDSVPGGAYNASLHVEHPD